MAESRFIEKLVKFLILWLWSALIIKKTREIEKQRAKN